MHDGCVRAGYYRGDKLWSVSHPIYGSCAVRAANAEKAMVAAAAHWGQRWQSVEFHSAVTVIKITP